MNFSTRRKRGRQGARFSRAGVWEAQQHGRGESFAILKFAVVADLLPSHVGDDVKPSIGVDHMGRSSEALAALLDYVTRGDLGVRFIQPEAHYANRLGPVLGANESVAYQLQSVEASHSDVVRVLQVLDAGALGL